MYFLLGHNAGSAHSGQEHGTLSGKEPEPLSSSPSTPASTPVEKAESGFVPGAGLPAIPATLVSRITRGEFIDLGELPSSVMVEGCKNLLLTQACETLTCMLWSGTISTCIILI